MRECNKLHAFLGSRQKQEKTLNSPETLRLNRLGGGAKGGEKGKCAMVSVTIHTRSVWGEQKLQNASILFGLFRATETMAMPTVYLTVTHLRLSGPINWVAWNQALGMFHYLISQEVSLSIPKPSAICASLTNKHWGGTRICKSPTQVQFWGLKIWLENSEMFADLLVNPQIIPWTNIP